LEHRELQPRRLKKKFQDTPLWEFFGQKRGWAFQKVEGASFSLFEMLAY
jgi:hypothetical protein